MVHTRSLYRRLPGYVTLVLVALVAGEPAVAQADPPGHTTIVSDVPSELTPNITDGAVIAIHDAGSKVIVGGTFTTVQNRDSTVDITRNFVLAVDKTTGDVDTGFAPVVDDEVLAVIAGPAPGTVYLAGRFNQVNGEARRKVALVNVADGSVVGSFVPPAFNGPVTDIQLAGSRLLAGGNFTAAGTVTRNGLASVDATTGDLDDYLTVALTEHHNYNGTGANAPVGVEKMAISPSGAHIVAIGNFKRANGVIHDQVVKIDLGISAATIADWNTDRYVPACARNAFDSYVRDVAYSTDGSYFVIGSTGAKFTGTLCDTVSRWENTAAGTALQPTWIAHSGGDTFLSVGISEQAVYVGGHIRWMNNSLGADRARAGAVPRASIAALDPINGIPLAWNPGRHPRGVGVTEMHVTAEGLWIGSDQEYIGNFLYRRARIAFFPTAGYTPHPTTVPSLPGNVYQAGNVVGAGTNDVRVRSYNGTTAGASSPVANPDGTAWSTARGAFFVGGSLFYGMNGALQRRTFDGVTFGPPSLVDPYHDPLWDTVLTGSGTVGQTYAGVTVDFYAEITNVTGMMYWQGRLYYTLSGQSGLFYRWFTPDSGIVGADKFTVSGATGFTNAGGMFVSGGQLYTADRVNGTLSRRAWVNGAPSGTATVVSGPAIDGADWRARAIWLHVTDNLNPTASFTASCPALACTLDASASTDPDGSIASYVWDFGDGTVGTGVSASHEYPAAGTYTVTLTVTDNRGGTGTATQTVITTLPPVTTVEFRDTAGVNVSSAAPSVVIPAGVQAGDGMVLALTAAANPLTVPELSGWTQLGVQTTSGATSVVWYRIAQIGDAGTSVTVPLGTTMKADLRLLAYAGTSVVTPIAGFARTAESTAVTAHAAPAVDVSGTGRWVVTLWSDKSSSTTAWTAPGGVSVRGTGLGTGGGRITTLAVDTGGTVPPGTYGPLTASTDAASRAIAWSLILNPTE